MVKVYAVSLALGVVGLVVVVYGGALMENLGRSDLDPGRALGRVGRATIGALTGLGMAGISAEFSPLGLTWQVSLAVALAGAVAGAVWSRWASRERADGDAGPV